VEETSIASNFMTIESISRTENAMTAQEKNTHVNRLQIEHLTHPFGIGVERPRLSWTVETAAQDWRQRAYEIEASAEDQPTRLSGRVDSSQSVLAPWPFDPLASRQRLDVRVRVWGQDGEMTDWSEPVRIETGLLQVSDWSAAFISPDWEEDAAAPQPAPFLRKEFNVRAGVKSARLYASALGVFELEMNGKVVGDHILDPGWTSYHHRLRYQTFDVSGLLREGRNAIGGMVADGWYRGKIGFGGGQRNIYGSRLALLAQLEIEYADGATERLVTDESWKAAAGPILLSGIYEGETYDARLEMDGWSQAGYADQAWKGVRAVDQDFGVLIAPVGPPVRRMQEIKPLSVFQSPSGKTLVDFGQNLVGRIRLTVEGPAGQTITLRHAEVLEHGELCTRPLRGAEATDRYTLRGGGPETWEARFTFHGFRYAEVDGWPGELRADQLSAVVLHSDMQRTGWFDCSDPLLNRLHENVVWGMRGNFLDLPTDCPQRDERLGWTGDIQVFTPTASFLYDVSGFLQSWLADLAADQKDAGGAVPAVIPNMMGRGFGGGAAAWADAAVVIPWVLYNRFGDREILAAQFESMHTWVDHVEKIAGERRLWDRGFQFGDWLDPTAPPDQPGAARTDKNIVATAYFARSAELVGLAAGILGRKEDEARYTKLAHEVRQAFAHEYVTPAGRLMSDAETAYALAIEFALLPTSEQRQRAGERLAELVIESGFHIRTGFVGTPLMCDALCSTGHYAIAYALLTQTDNPSWLYPVTMGATTIWERWDSLLPDGSVNPGEMTSFNHYALGAVADWMHRTIAGLAPAEPGYQRIDVQPRPGGRLTHATARHLTPYGLAEVAWKIAQDTFALDVVVPPNTRARVTFPGSQTAAVDVGSGTYHWSYAYAKPDAHPPLTIDNTIGELMQDPESWKAVIGAVKRVTQGRGFLLRSLGSNPDLVLRQAFSRGPFANQEIISAVEQALAEVNS
jgi:alpha-L-rhamnosidase